MHIVVGIIKICDIGLKSKVLFEIALDLFGCIVGGRTMVEILIVVVIRFFCIDGMLVCCKAFVLDLSLIHI